MNDWSDHQRIGEYELVARIGAGGFSTVYKARHLLMGRLVALKLPRREHAEDEKLHRRFRIEIRLAGMLSHPNILRAYDAREVDGVPYLVMELCRGEDLAETVRSHDALPVPKAISAIRQAACGLEFAHEQGVVHRDVKPANLFLTDQDVVLVFDWGLARCPEFDAVAPEAETGRPVRPAIGPFRPEPWAPRAARSFADEEDKIAKTLLPAAWNRSELDPRQVEETQALTISRPREHDDLGADISWGGHIVGTPAFMAPEQVRTSDVDHRADIYSLGCTLYYLLAGRPMYGGHIRDVLTSHVKAPVPSLLEDRGPDVPNDLEAVFRRMVAKDPADRYQRMSDVVDALDRLEGGSKIFISYRREDSIDATDRMYEKLAGHFGADNVFMDVDTIPPGADFRRRLQDAVSQCSIVLAVIGAHWLDASEGGWLRRRRLRDHNDFVRIEIEAALNRGIPVIPVLVGGAQMPPVRRLPGSLRELAYQQAAELRPGRDYQEHLTSLIRSIEDHLRRRLRSP